MILTGFEPAISFVHSAYVPPSSQQLSGSAPPSSSTKYANRLTGNNILGASMSDMLLACRLACKLSMWDVRVVSLLSVANLDDKLKHIGHLCAVYCCRLIGFAAPGVKCIEHPS